MKGGVMVRKFSFVAVVLLSVCLMVGGASAITLDGDLSDWGIAGNDLLVAGNQLAGASVVGMAGGVRYWEEDSDRTGYVEPAYGGEKFDIEGLYYTANASNAYVAAVVGMGPGQYSQNHTYGDVFITTTAGLYAVTTFAHDSLAAGQLYEVTGTRDAVVAPASSPAQMTAGNLVAGGAGLAYVQSGWYGTDNDWVIELSIDTSLLNGDITGIHLTQTCGNDSATLSTVPEPASLALFGGGLLVLAVIGRRRFK